MKIEKTLNNGKITLSLSGRLDSNTSPEFQETLLSEYNTAKHIELDFGKLIYISSAGVRALLKGQQTAEQKNGSLILYNVSPEIMEIFEMTGFGDILNIK